MRRNKVVVIAFAVLGAACTPREVPYAGIEVGADNAAVDAVFAEWDQPGGPGCALAVAQDGDFIYTRGYGYANLDYDIPVTPQTIFDVASVTKQFVAASLTMLALDGELSLDDDVREWLPELPAYDTPITLQHMIYHTSGLRDYLNLFPLAGRGHYYPISHPQILDMMSRQRALNFPAGDRYEYSNTAYMLLAQVVERASGQTLGEFAQERIFDPLGMSGSLMYDNYERIIPGRATGYDRLDDGRVLMVHNYNFDVAGDGQMYTTVEDLLRWDNYLHGAEKPAVHEQMLTVGRLNNGESTGYAQGIRVSEYRGLATVQHTGSSWGSRSVLMRFVEPGLSISVACNDGNSSPMLLAREVADILLADRLGPVEAPADDEEEHKPAGDPFELSSEALSSFAGTFFSEELDATYRIALAGDVLQVRIEQEPPLAVRPLADDRFEIGFRDQAYWDQPMATMDFQRNDDGAISGFLLSSGSEKHIGFAKRQ
jgi:CubicO group peptidase (beta-lactamase class C family)